MLSRIVQRFATTTNKTFGNLKDSDRIFTNVYKDSDPYIKGALRRVSNGLGRATGTRPRTSLATASTGSSTKSNSQDSEAEAELVSPQDSNTPSCPKSPLPNDPATWSSTLTSQSLEPARTEKFLEETLISWSKVPSS